MEEDIVSRLIKDGSIINMEAADKIIKLRERGKYWERECKNERAKAFDKSIGVKYQPKGGMCSNCKKANDDCSFLDFSAMKVIDTFYEFGKVKIVICSQFVRINKHDKLNE
jgi:hypothetical protein